MTTVLPGVPLVAPRVPASPAPGPSGGVAVASPPLRDRPADHQPTGAPVLVDVPDQRAVPAAEARSGPTSAGRARHGGPGRSRPAAAAASSRVGHVLLNAAALLGLVVMALTVFAMTTGLKPLVVRSGSMEPTIPTGGMVLVRTIPADEIEVGDVIAVERPDNTRVMHRVVSVERDGPTAEVVLKGDANEDVDPVPVVVSEAGELVFSTPVVGRVSAFLASAKGGFVLGSVMTAVLMTVLRRRA